MIILKNIFNFSDFLSIIKGSNNKSKKNLSCPKDEKTSFNRFLYKNFKKAFSLSMCIVLCSNINAQFGIDPGLRDINRNSSPRKKTTLETAKEEAYFKLRERVHRSEGDDLHWGGDKPVSFSWEAYKYDLPLLSSSRIVDVNEFDVVFGMFEVWDTEFDLHFDKDVYREINFQELYRLSSVTGQGRKALELFLGSFSLEFIAYLMNNDVRYGRRGYDNPLPNFKKYNRFVIRIVRQIYQLWNSSSNYNHFLRQFYNHLPGTVLGSASETEAYLRAFDNSDFCGNVSCADHWFIKHNQNMSTRPLREKRNSLDEDDGWTNPFDWFGFHDQQEIDRLDMKISRAEIIQNIVRKIHTIHNNKDSMFRELEWGRSRVAWESLANFGIIALAAVTVFFGPEVMAGAGAFLSKSSVAASLKTKGLITISAKTGGGVVVAMNPAVVTAIGVCATAAIFLISHCTQMENSRIEAERHQEYMKEQRRQTEEQRRQTEILKEIQRQNQQK